MLAANITIELGDNFLAAFLALPTIIAAVAATIAARRTKELKPNGGSSIKDHVTQVHKSVEKRAPHTIENPTSTESVE